MLYLTQYGLLYDLAVVAEDPECRVDADCFSGLACIRDRCQNPCQLSNPCRAGQKCVVEDTLPLRTMACICPDGFYIGDSGECIQGMDELWLPKYIWKNAKKNNVFTVTAVSQCRIHPDCRTTEQCHTGTCLDACRVEQCGTNAICTSRDHSIICTCPPNYTGDARIACYPSEYHLPIYIPYLLLFGITVL